MVIIAIITSQLERQTSKIHKVWRLYLMLSIFRWIVLKANQESLITRHSFKAINAVASRCLIKIILILIISYLQATTHRMMKTHILVAYKCIHNFMVKFLSLQTLQRIRCSLINLQILLWIKETILWWCCKVKNKCKDRQ